MSHIRDWILRWVFHQPSEKITKADATAKEREAERLKQRNADAVNRAKVLQREVDATLESIRRGM